MDFKFIIAIIAFIVISNLFKKVSKQVQSNKMSSFGGSADGEGPLNLEETGVEQTVVMKERENEHPTYSFSTTHQDEIQNIQGRNQPSRSGFTNTKMNEPIIASSKKKNISQNGELDPNQVIQGMMWSEIFGPPRSKKPYSYPKK